MKIRASAQQRPRPIETSMLPVSGGVCLYVCVHLLVDLKFKRKQRSWFFSLSSLQSLCSDICISMLQIRGAEAALCRQPLSREPLQEHRNPLGSAAGLLSFQKEEQRWLCVGFSDPY